MEHEYSGMTFESKPSEHTCDGCYFHYNTGCCSTPTCDNIIWIKKENSVKATEEITFTPAQTSSSSSLFWR